MSEDILAIDNCVKILHGRFKRSDFKYINHKTRPYSENMEGLLGDHYKLEITYQLDEEKRVENFFLKIKPTKTEVQEVMTSELNVYPKEIFWYTFLLKEFEERGYDTSFSANCYYHVPGKLLVLDDMRFMGYRVPKLYKPFDLYQCKSGLKSLALMHAAGFMYEESKTKELGRLFRLNLEYPKYLAQEKMFEHSPDKKNFGYYWIKVCLDGFLDLIDYLEESEECKEQFKNRLSARKLGEIFTEETKFRKTIGHGDLWSNNMLFKLHNGNAMQCCLIDYQLIRYFHPVFDVYLIIYTNTSREFRQQHWSELLDYYYNTLASILARHDYSISEIYPQEDFRTGLKICEFEAKVQSFSSLSFSCLTPEDFSKQAQQDGNALDDLLFNDRRPLMHKYFISDEKYRKLMLDCLYDLHDLFFKE